MRKHKQSKRIKTIRKQKYIDQQNAIQRNEHLPYTARQKRELELLQCDIVPASKEEASNLIHKLKTKLFGDQSRKAKKARFLDQLKMVQGYRGLHGKLIDNKGCLQVNIMDGDTTIGVCFQNMKFHFPKEKGFFVKDLKQAFDECAARAGIAHKPPVVLDTELMQIIDAIPK